MNPSEISTPRRTILKGSSAALFAAFAGPIAALASRTAQASACAPASASLLSASPYGPVAPVNDLVTGLPLIQLPAGFSYKSYGWTGDVMSDGLLTPSAHDGMGLVRTRKVGRSTEMVLVRNHERSTSTNAANIIGASKASVAKYDTGGTISGTNTNYQVGGTTNIVFRDGNFVESYASFGGTFRNCAGGSSNWGSWLTNEEIRSNAVSSSGKRHGYVFEVPADTSQNSANTLPIFDMGRMAHEASALDSDTGFWYLTEDQGNANTLYRFRPTDLDGGLNSLHSGGLLQGLKVKGVEHADLRLPTLCRSSRWSGPTLAILTRTVPLWRLWSAMCRPAARTCRLMPTGPQSLVLAKVAGWPTVRCSLPTNRSLPARCARVAYGRSTWTQTYSKRFSSATTSWSATHPTTCV